MRAFILSLSLIISVIAKPQYNYESGPISVPQVHFNTVVNTPQYTTQQVSTSQYNTQPISSGPIGSSGLFGTQQLSSPQYNTQPISSGPLSSLGQINTQPIGSFGSQQISSVPISTQQFVTPQVGGPHYEEPVQQIHQAPLITKQFYLHSAPEDHDAVHRTKHLVLGRPQKNYRVIFIKKPSESNANVHLSAEYAPQEEKTVIYVLSQKDTALDIDNIATPAPTQPSKPEVFFIKYKTPEEAAHAQREIQNQYDVLGGATSVEDRGHAPVTSVVGALSRPVDNHALNNLGNEYLPAHKA